MLLSFHLIFESLFSLVLPALYWQFEFYVSFPLLYFEYQTHFINSIKSLVSDSKKISLAFISYLARQSVASNNLHLQGSGIMWNQYNFPVFLISESSISSIQEVILIPFNCKMFQLLSDSLAPLLYGSLWKSNFYFDFSDGRCCHQAFFNNGQFFFVIRIRS